MGTISKDVYISGFCPIDKQKVRIPIEYCSFSDIGDTKKDMTFIKTKNNHCRYIKEGKCNKGIECPIWKEAESTKKLDVSDLNW